MPPYRRVLSSPRFRSRRAEKIAPEAVDRATFSAYQAHCAAFALKYQPASSARVALLARVALSNWNWAHRNVPDWPGKPVNSVRTESFTPPPTAYPQSFQDDVACYANRLRGRDLEDIFTRDVAALDASAAGSGEAPPAASPDNHRLVGGGVYFGAAGALVGAGVEPSASPVCVTSSIHSTIPSASSGHIWRGTGG